MKNKKIVKKIRKRCYLCGAMKYTKYMSKIGTIHKGKKELWYCKNEDKCTNRCANYKG